MKKYIIKNVPIENKTKLHLCSKNAEPGDKIVVFLTDGVTTQIRGVETGILTRKWEKDEYPTCEIDGKSFDLVSEGHTSDVYKVICEVYQSEKSWIKENMEFDDSEVKITHCFDYKKGKDLDVNDRVEVNHGTPFPIEGIIKEVKLKYDNASDWEDEIVLTNVKKAIEFTPNEGDGWKYQDMPDMIVKRGDIQDRNKRIVYECEIKCPCCGHFCYSC